MNKSLETQNHKDNQDDKKMQESGLSPEGNDYKPIVEIRPLYGCDFSDPERINTLADADWLTRRLTSLYRDRIMSRLLRRFRRVSSFVIILDTKVDENTHEVKAVSFDLCGLYCGDQNIDAESKQVALSMAGGFGLWCGYCEHDKSRKAADLVSIFHRIPLVEEFTGLSCTNCPPRGPLQLGTVKSGVESDYDYRLRFLAFPVRSTPRNF